MTVNYEFSVKLHEKYPAMGRDSYWVWRRLGGIHGFIQPERVYLDTRAEVIENDAEWSIVCPALTLGELLKTEQFKQLIDRGFFGESVDNLAMILTCAKPENAASQAILEGGM